MQVVGTAIKLLRHESTNMTETKTKPTRRFAREPKTQDVIVAAAGAPESAPRTPSKIAIVVGLLERPSGASLDELVSATGWLPHTTRAALTGLRKKGHDVSSAKADGMRTYRITPPPAGDVASTGDSHIKLET